LIGELGNLVHCGKSELQPHPKIIHKVFVGCYIFHWHCLMTLDDSLIRFGFELH